MIEIYQAKGMSLKDATQIIDIMAQYRDVFVDAMMVDELGIYFQVMQSNFVI